MPQVYLAFGSNLGDREAHFVVARERLESLAQGTIKSAALYETDPLDCPEGSAPFLNSVVSFQTALRPHELLTATQAIEHELGRALLGKRARHDARPIDLDILIYDDLAVSDSELIIPHPRMHERLFVLTPLRDLVPSLVPPTHANPIAILLELVDSDELPPTLVKSSW